LHKLRLHHHLLLHGLLLLEQLVLAVELVDIWLRLVVSLGIHESREGFEFWLLSGHTFFNNYPT
jgi:hypothetical protein